MNLSDTSEEINELLTNKRLEPEAIKEYEKIYQEHVLWIGGKVEGEIEKILKHDLEGLVAKLEAYLENNPIFRDLMFYCINKNQPCLNKNEET